MKRISSVLVIVTVLSLVLSPLLAFADSIAGRWEGVAVASPDPDIPFSVEFKEQDGGLKATMDIPSQGLYGLELTEVKLEGKTLEFVVPVPDSPVTCSAQLKEDGTMIGTYDRLGQTGRFSMKRSE